MKDIDVEGQGSTKRPHPKARRTAKPKQGENPSIRHDPEKLANRKSAATIAALRMVVRKEIANGMSAMEDRITNKMEEQVRSVQQDMEEENQARFLLEIWRKKQFLEQKENLKSGADNAVETVDKPIAVVGGFGNKTLSCCENCLLVWIGLMVCCG